MVALVYKLQCLSAFVMYLLLINQMVSFFFILHMIEITKNINEYNSFPPPSLNLLKLNIINQVYDYVSAVVEFIDTVQY